MLYGEELDEKQQVSLAQRWKQLAWSLSKGNKVIWPPSIKTTIFFFL